jgi:hypothetical protein
MLRMRKSCLLTLLFSIFAFTVLAQQENVTPTIEILGEIRDQISNEAVPFVHIINENSGIGTVSNEQGRFWMEMNPTDTLIFSAIGFESYAFTLKEDVKSRRIEITIALNTSTMELEPVKIFAYRDEESLKQALLNLDVPESVDNSRMELPGFYYGPRIPHKPGLSSPISFIASKFSKREKELKKVTQAEIEDDYRKLIQAKYNESVVMELTGLPEDKVKDFMDFCKIEESFISRSGPYEIALAVHQCLKKYSPEN